MAKGKPIKVEISVLDLDIVTELLQIVGEMMQDPRVPPDLYEKAMEKIKIISEEARINE